MTTTDSLRDIAGKRVVGMERPGGQRGREEERREIGVERSQLRDRTSDDKGVIGDIYSCYVYRTHVSARNFQEGGGTVHMACRSKKRAIKARDILLEET
eukprot:1328354-Amorphochlora_amoeboformis.AAC.1